jgi:hypothetical protein
MLIINAEKSPRARLSTKRHVICCRRSDDIWVLESWKGDSGTEVGIYLFHILSSFEGIEIELIIWDIVS